MYDTVTIAQCGLVSQPRDPGAEPCHVHLVADWVGKVIGYIWHFGPCCILIPRWMEDIPEVCAAAARVPCIGCRMFD